MDEYRIGIGVLTWENQRHFCVSNALVSDLPGKHNPRLYRNRPVRPTKGQSEQAKRAEGHGKERTGLVLWTTISDSEPMLVIELLSSSLSPSGGLETMSELDSELDCASGGVPLSSWSP